MKKIPVKIVQYTINGETRKNVMIDMIDTYNIEGDAESKINNFKKKYFELIKKAQGIMPKEKSKRKSSHFWKIGKLLFDFNKSIENKFEITNFNQAIIRDFGLYDQSHFNTILHFGEFFTKKDIDDSISMSSYLELIWKANSFKKFGLFEKEKKRLLKMAKEKTLPSHKSYREDLNKLVKSIEKKSRGK